MTPLASRALRSLAVLMLAASCVSSPSTRPNEREWSRLMADFEWLQTLRRSVPQPNPAAPRKEQIETLLENHRKLGPSSVAFLDKLHRYHQRTGDPRAARFFANEKVRMGDEYMNVLSRYDRAILMYESALAIDPSHPEAGERMALARSRRFVTPDGFGAIRPGMKEVEVSASVGIPREDWIKQVIQRNRTFSVWIYPREDGGASAIYFENGVVYYTNWNAAPPGASESSAEK